MTRLMLARLAMVVAVFGGGFVAYAAFAQNGTPPVLPLAPPAPYDSPAIRALPVPAPAVPKEPPVLDGKAAESLITTESVPHHGSSADSKPESGETRFTFSRVTDGYVRLDNRTGQVSFCSKRTVGWTCQIAPEDRIVLENEVARLQEENATLKKELLTQGLPLPGSMKGEPPVARNDRSFSLPIPSDPNIDRMKVMVEKAWRQLVDMITALQKDVLKKS